MRQALLLDDENDFILKNLGYLLCQNGEYPNALVVLKDIKHKDFAVLDLIAKCQDLKINISFVFIIRKNDLYAYV